MRCFHFVKSYEWTQCPKCGKIVRLKKKIFRIYSIILFLSSGICAPLFVDHFTSFIKIENAFLAKIVYFGIGALFIVLISIIFLKLFPIYEEKSKHE